MNNTQHSFVTRGEVVGAVIVVLALIAGFLFWLHWEHEHSSGAATTSTPVSMAHFVCDQGKTIDASFYSGAQAPTPAPGQPPTPTGSVTLKLSDGRSENLPQTISGSGIRYANADESFIFWSEGNTAFVEEGPAQTQTYTNCIASAPASANLSQVYANNAMGFSIRYPNNYTVDPTYTYQELGPGKDISGVKFTIPASLTTGTNLGNDSYLSVEQIPNASTCSASLFVDQGNEMSPATTVTQNGTTYSVATSTGAGAGNLYDETVYAIPGTSPCVAVRYFIHSGNIYNYPTGTVQAFDRASLVAQFDAIRQTLVIGK